MLIPEASSLRKKLPVSRPPIMSTMLSELPDQPVKPEQRDTIKKYMSG
jgi:hypothetical protein